MNYLLHILTMISIYSILALSLNLLIGYTGLLSLSHAAFYGIGAYIGTLASIELRLPFFLSLLLAIAGTSALSFIISLPSLRLKGDYFVLASLSFQTIVFTVLYNWVGVTRGPFGISNIPRPNLFGFEVNSAFAYFVFSITAALACVGLLYLLGHSPFGRVLKAIREDEMAAAVMGKNIMLFKVVAFAIAAGFAAIAGVLFAGYVRYLDPTSFTLMESVFIVSIIIIGGAGNISGPLIGTVLLVILPEILRFVGIPDTIAPNMRQIIYGMLIILVMRYKPQGISGEYRFG
jgi:branched-chain amino acid transport system permease protein